MAFIDSISDEEAAGDVAERFDALRTEKGFVPNGERVLARRPDVSAASQELITCIRDHMDPRRYELISCAAARRLRSSYCMLAHSVALTREVGVDGVRDMLIDPDAPALDQLDRAIVAFTEKVVGDAASITQQDIDRLRNLGMDDVEILDAVLAAALRCFVAKSLDAVGALPDAAFAALEPAVRERLVVGRPIAGSA